jgi:hypothetical protein
LRSDTVNLCNIVLRYGLGKGSPENRLDLSKFGFGGKTALSPSDVIASRQADGVCSRAVSSVFVSELTEEIYDFRVSISFVHF